MRAFEFLKEDVLAPGELFKPKYLGWRPQALLTKLSNPKATFRERIKGENGKWEYINITPAPGELERLTVEVNAALKKLEKNPHGGTKPSLVLKTSDNRTVPFSNIEKDELQKASGALPSKVNVQPIGIGIAADPINAPGTKKKDRVVLTSDEEIKRALDANKGVLTGNLGNIIINNKILKDAGELGAAIIQTATDFMEDRDPDLSKYDESIQKRVAIDAGEYLGILAMATGKATWSNDKQEKFLNFLGVSDLNNLTLIFPGEQNASLSDSYGVQNSATGHTILISSKGGIGKSAVGAAPAISGLKLPENLTKKVKKGGAVDFLQLIQGSSVAYQPFVGMNFLGQYYPNVLKDTLYGELMTVNGGVVFTNEDIKAIELSRKTGSAIPRKFLRLIRSRKVTAKATKGGIVIYATFKDLVEIINTQSPIKDFRTVILETLDQNFVQVFSRVIGGKLQCNILWPGKIDGNVALHTKAEAASPTSAGLSFKITD
jgi:hypothetical protein